MLVTGGRFDFFVQIGFIFSLTGSLDAIMYGGITSTPSSCKNDLEHTHTKSINHARYSDMHDEKLRRLVGDTKELGLCTCMYVCI